MLFWRSGMIGLSVSIMTSDVHETLDGTSGYDSFLFHLLTSRSIHMACDQANLAIELHELAAGFRVGANAEYLAKTFRAVGHTISYRTLLQTLLFT